MAQKDPYLQQALQALSPLSSGSSTTTQELFANEGQVAPTGIAENIAPNYQHYTQGLEPYLNINEQKQIEANRKLLEKNARLNAGSVAEAHTIADNTINRVTANDSLLLAMDRALLQQQAALDGLAYQQAMQNLQKQQLSLEYQKDPGALSKSIQTRIKEIQDPRQAMDARLRQAQRENEVDLALSTLGTNAALIGQKYNNAQMRNNKNMFLQELKEDAFANQTAQAKQDVAEALVARDMEETYAPAVTSSTSMNIDNGQTEYIGLGEKALDTVLDLPKNLVEGSVNLVKTGDSLINLSDEDRASQIQAIEQRDPSLLTENAKAYMQRWDGITDKASTHERKKTTGYGLDNIQADWEHTQGMDSVLAGGKQVAGAFADAMIESAPEMLASSLGFGLAGRGANLMANALKTKVDDVAEAIVKAKRTPIAKEAVATARETVKATPGITGKEAFLQARNEITEATRKNIASKLGERKKDQLVKGAAKLGAGGAVLAGITANTADKAVKDSWTKKGYNAEAMSSLVSVSPKELPMAIAHTGLNAIELKALFGPFLNSKTGKALGDMLLGSKSPGKESVSNVLKAIAKDTTTPSQAKAGLAAAMLRIGGAATAEGLTEGAQTVLEQMLKDYRGKPEESWLSHLQNAFKTATSKGENWEEVEESGILGAIAGGGMRGSFEGASKAKGVIAPVTDFAKDQIESRTQGKVKAKEEQTRASTINSDQAITDETFSVISDGAIEISQGKETKVGDTITNEGLKAQVKETQQLVASLDESTSKEKFDETIQTIQAQYPKISKQTIETSVRQFILDKATDISTIPSYLIEETTRKELEAIGTDEEIYNTLDRITKKELGIRDNTPITVSQRIAIWQRAQEGAENPIFNTKEAEEKYKSNATNPTEEKSSKEYVTRTKSVDGESVTISKISLDGSFDDSHTITSRDIDIYNRATQNDDIAQYNDVALDEALDDLDSLMAHAETATVREAAIVGTKIGQAIQNFRNNVLTKSKEDLATYLKNNPESDRLFNAIARKLAKTAIRDESGKVIDYGFESALFQYLNRADNTGVRRKSSQRDNSKSSQTLQTTEVENVIDNAFSNLMDRVNGILRTSVSADVLKRRRNNIAHITAEGVTGSTMTFVSDILGKLQKVLSNSDRMSDRARMKALQNITNILEEALKNKISKSKAIQKVLNKNRSNLNSFLADLGISTENFTDYFIENKENMSPHILLKIDTRDNHKTFSLVPASEVSYRSMNDYTNFVKKGAEKGITYMYLTTSRSQNTNSADIFEFSTSAESQDIVGLNKLREELQKEQSTITELIKIIDTHTRDARHIKAVSMSTLYLDAVNTNEREYKSLVNSITKSIDITGLKKVQNTMGIIAKWDRELKKLKRARDMINNPNRALTGENITYRGVGGNRVEVSLDSGNLSEIVNAIDSIQALKEQATFTLQNMFNEDKKAQDVMALVFMYNSAMISRGATRQSREALINNAFSNGAKGMIRPFLDKVARFFSHHRDEMAVFNEQLKQTNEIRALHNLEPITIEGLEELSKAIALEELSDPLTNSDRIHAAKLAVELSGIVGNKRFEVIESISAHIPEVRDILPSLQSQALSGAINLTKNLVGGYFLPNIAKLGKLKFFEDIQRYKAGSLDFETFNRAVSDMFANSESFTVNPSNMFLDMMDTYRNDNGEVRIKGIKPAYVKILYAGYLNALYNNDKKTPAQNMFKTDSEKKAHVTVTSSYNAKVASNMLLDILGLEARGDISIGAIENAKSSLGTMVQVIFSNVDKALEARKIVKVSGKDSSLYVLAGNTIELKAIQQDMINKTYIGTSEIASKEHLSDVLRDFKLGEKGNIFKTEASTAAVMGNIAMSLNPMKYNVRKLRNSVYSYQDPTEMAKEIRASFNKSSKRKQLTISDDLWNTQILPYLDEVASRLGIQNTNLYATTVKEALGVNIIKLSNETEVAELQRELMRNNSIANIQGSIKGVIDAITELESDRGTKGVSFYYNYTSSVNDRASADGGANHQGNKIIRKALEKLKYPENLLDFINNDPEGKAFYQKVLGDIVYWYSSESNPISVDDYKTISDLDFHQHIVEVIEAGDYVKIFNSEQVLARDALLAQRDEIVSKVDYDPNELATLDKRLAELTKEAEQVIREKKQKVIREAREAIEEIYRAIKDTDDTTTRLAKYRALIESKRSINGKVRGIWKDFDSIPNHTLLDVFDSVLAYKTGLDKVSTPEAMQKHLIKALRELGEEKDGQTYGPGNIASQNGADRFNQRIAASSGITIRDMAAIATDPDNYINTAIQFFNQLFNTIQDSSLASFIPNLNKYLDIATKEGNTKEKLIEEFKAEFKENVIEAVKEKYTFKGLEEEIAFEGQLGLIFEEAFFSDADKATDFITNIEKYPTIGKVMEANVSALRSLAKPILQLSGYGSGPLNNAKGFTSAFFIQEYADIAVKILSKMSVMQDREGNFNSKKVLLDRFGKPAEGENTLKTWGLTQREIDILKVLRVNSVDDMRQLAKLDRNGLLDTTNLETALRQNATAFSEAIDVSLRKMTPMATVRNNLSMALTEFSLDLLYERLSSKLHGYGIKKTSIVDENTGQTMTALDITGIPNEVLNSTLQALLKDPEFKMFMGIFKNTIDDPESSVMSFFTQLMRPSGELGNVKNPLGAGFEENRVYITPVGLSLITNFGQSFDARVQGIVQQWLSELGLHGATDQYDALTNNAATAPFSAYLANKATALLLTDRSENYQYQMFKKMSESSIFNQRIGKFKDGAYIKDMMNLYLAQMEDHYEGLKLKGGRVGIFGGDQRGNATDYIIEGQGTPEEIAQYDARRTIGERKKLHSYGSEFLSKVAEFIDSFPLLKTAFNQQNHREFWTSHMKGLAQAGILSATSPERATRLQVLVDAIDLAYDQSKDGYATNLIESLNIIGETLKGDMVSIMDDLKSQIVHSREADISKVRNHNDESASPLIQREYRSARGRDILWNTLPRIFHTLVKGISNYMPINISRGLEQKAKDLPVYNLSYNTETKGFQYKALSDTAWSNVPVNNQVELDALFPVGTSFQLDKETVEELKKNPEAVLAYRTLMADNTRLSNLVYPNKEKYEGNVEISSDNNQSRDTLVNNAIKAISEDLEGAEGLQGVLHAGAYLNALREAINSNRGFGKFTLTDTETIYRAIDSRIQNNKLFVLSPRATSSNQPRSNIGNAKNFSEVYNQLVNEAVIDTIYENWVVPSNFDPFPERPTSKEELSHIEANTAEREAAIDLNTLLNPSSKSSQTYRGQNRTNDTVEEQLASAKEIVAEIDAGIERKSIDDLLSELGEIEAVSVDQMLHLRDVLNTLVTGNQSQLFRDGLKIKIMKTDGETRGDFFYDSNIITIQIGEKPNKVGLSGAEAYVHEIIHAVTHYAIATGGGEIAALVARAENLRKQFLAKYRTKEAKLELANEIGITGTDTQKIATLENSYLRYMEGDIEEFLAIGMSNYAIHKSLSEMNVNNETGKSFLDRFIGTISRILQVLMGGDIEIDLANKTGAQELYSIVNKISSANNEFKDVYRELTYSDKLTKIFNGLNRVSNALVGQWINRQRVQIKNAGDPKNVLAFAKFLMFAPRDAVIAKRARDLLVNKFGRSPMGFFVETLSNISTLDGPKKMVNNLLAEAANWDRERIMMTKALEQELKEAFTAEITEQEANLLGKIIVGMDMSSLGDSLASVNFTIFDAPLAKDIRDNIYSEYKRTLRELSEASRALVKTNEKYRAGNLVEYYTQEANKLGDYLGKGTRSNNLLMNAYNIAHGLNNASIRDNVTKTKTAWLNEEEANQIVPIIDKLITLRAMSHLPDSDLSEFRKLLDKDFEGISKAFDMQRVSKHGLEDEFRTKGEISNEVKGYMRGQTNQAVDIIVAPLGDRVDLYSQGYDLVKDFSSILNTGGQGLAVYVSKTNTKARYNRGALRTTSGAARGMTISSAINALMPGLSVKDKEATVASMIANIKKGNVADFKEFAPIFNTQGNIVDYKLILSPTEKTELGIQDTNLFDIIPTAIARYSDKLNTQIHNEKTLDALEKFYLTNRGKETFIYIGPESIKDMNSHLKLSDKEILRLQEMWDLLPSKTKEHLSYKEGMNQGIYIQASQISSIGGSRDIQITDSEIFKRVIPIPYFRRVAKIVEFGLKKLAGYTTQKIVTTNPEVIIGNLTSNQYTLTSFGVDPVTAMKGYADGINEIKSYNILKQKEVNLKKELLLEKDKESNKAIKLGRDLKDLQDKIKSHPIHAYDERGLISDIADDLTKRGFQQDFIDQNIEKVLNRLHVPQAFRDAFDIVMVNEGTTLHQAYATLVKYSDLLARIVLKKHLERTTDMSNEKIFDLLDRAFINYTPAQHPIVKYLNDIGFARFTKYWLRIQSHLTTDMLDKQLGTTLALHGVANMLGIPLSTPLNAFIGRKFMNSATTFSTPGVYDIENIYDDIADGFVITNPLIAIQRYF